MFNFFYLIAPSFFKANKERVLKYLKIIAVFIVLTAIAVFTYNAYTTFTGIVKESIDNRLLLQKQTDMLAQQVSEIQSMEIQIKKLSESHEVTKELLHELSKEEKQIEKQVEVKKKKVRASIKEIEKQDIPQAQKDELKSAVLIHNLNDTYCELFPDNCKT